MGHCMDCYTIDQGVRMASPLKLDILNIDEYIRKNNVQEVTSMFIRESSSTEFDRNGLFSENIFGQIGTPERLVKFGYVNLRCKVLHPIIYNNVLTLVRWYGDIMSGKEHAIFSETERVFVKASPDTGSTGYTFFLNNIPKVNFGKSDSLKQQDKIDIFEKNKTNLTIDKMLVLPAGWRDVTVEDTRVDKDSINKLYTSLLNYARALPTGGSGDSLYDSVMFAIQKKVCEIFQYLFDISEGKKGFFQRKYGSRALALGTRNVISTSDLSATSPTSADYLKVDEVGVPLFQASKMFMPLMVYSMKTYFFNEIFSTSADNVAVINQKTLGLEYVPVTENEKNKFLSSEGIEKIVNLFRDKSNRHRPVQVYSEDNDSYYYFSLMYDDGRRIVRTRSVSELKQFLELRKMPFNPKFLRPMAYSELIYIASYFATQNRYSYLTRYPAVEMDSLVPSKVHLLSTDPSRSVDLLLTADELADVKKYKFPNYPVIDADFVDSVSLHPSVLKGLGADFDGDTVSLSGALSTEANEECASYLNDKHRYINPSGKLVCGKTDILSLTIGNLSRDP